MVFLSACCRCPPSAWLTFKVQCHHCRYHLYGTKLLSLKLYMHLYQSCVPSGGVGGWPQVGQFEAEMSSDSFQLLGMAERGFLPAVLAKRSRFDTPTLGIVLSSLGICCLVSFNFLQARDHNAIHRDAQVQRCAVFLAPISSYSISFQARLLVACHLHLPVDLRGMYALASASMQTGALILAAF